MNRRPHFLSSPFPYCFCFFFLVPRGLGLPSLEGRFFRRSLCSQADPNGQRRSCRTWGTLTDFPSPFFFFFLENLPTASGPPGDLKGLCLGPYIVTDSTQYSVPVLLRGLQAPRTCVPGPPHGPPYVGDNFEAFPLVLFPEGLAPSPLVSSGFIGLELPERFWRTVFLPPVLLLNRRCCCGNTTVLPQLTP